MNWITEEVKSMLERLLNSNLLALMAFTVVLMGVSVWRFRKQLN